LMRGTKAFTLIELLIATSLITVVLMSVLYFSISSVRLIMRSAVNAKSSQVTRFVADRIYRDIIQSTGASAASSSGKLMIGRISYEFRDKKVRREEGNDIYYLTTEGEISGLKFSYPTPKLVRIEITPKIGDVLYINAYARN
jgi:prepilin-type N-terminal cleavage/methylation domain-containing protein